LRRHVNQHYNIINIKPVAADLVAAHDLYNYPGYHEGDQE
jgi:hypothetical protein